MSSDVMKIAVASGKGGTGKTFVSTNLANVARESSPVALYDLDVDEPNCHLFFGFETEFQQTARSMIPSVDNAKCSHCGVCGDVCEYNAIVSLAADVLIFPELCHGCYACLELCPEKAITEGFKEIGTVTVSRGENLTLVTGKLAIGQPATTALVRRAKSEAVPDADLVLYDAPPGTTCPVIEAVRDVDYTILVGEPTRFGLHDMELMVQTLRQLNRPFGVIVNKADAGHPIIEEYCRGEGIEVIAVIPERFEIAEAYGRGELVTDRMPDLRRQFADAFEKALGRVREVTA
jgi:MinD superfamily P-loop ATPase